MSDLDRRLRRDGLTLGGFALAGFAADYLLNVVLSRLLDAHAFGDYRVASSFATLLAIVVALGGERLAPKVLSTHFAGGHAAEVWEYLRFFLRSILGLSAIVIVGTWTLAVWSVGPSVDQHHALIWLVAAVPLVAAGELFSKALLAAGHPTRAAAPWRLGFPLALVGAVAILQWAGGSVSLHEALGATIAVLLALGTVQWLQLRRLALPRLQRAISFRTPRSWLAVSLPMMGTSLVATGLAQADLYFLEVLGDEAEVGHYAAASTTAGIVLLVQATLVTLVSPLLEPALERSAAEARDLLAAGRRLLLIAVAPLVVALGLLAAPILSLFGDGFADARIELILLLVANLCWALAAFAALRLEFAGAARTMLAISLATLALDVALDLLLIPRLGMRGAALASVVSFALGGLAVALAARRRPLDGGGQSLTSSSTTR